MLRLLTSVSTLALAFSLTSATSPAVASATLASATRTSATLASPAVASPALASYPRWAWPVRGSHEVVRPYIAPATQYSAGHRGIDIAASGDVLAPADGIVHFSGFVVDRDLLSIEHPDDILSSYEPVLSPLQAGDFVTRGEVIGQIEAGHCTELCLHFGVRIHGEYVSPMLFLGGVVRPILLPTRSLGLSHPRAANYARGCAVL